MCGIVGISLRQENKQNFIDAATGVFRSLLVENTERGKHSTGIVYLYKDEYEIYKGFAKGSEAQNFVWSEHDTEAIFGHVRHATVGKTGDRNNIHPFETEKYIGVHNGTIFNHKIIASHFNIERLGQCDSEIIFRLLDRYGIRGLMYLEGLYSVCFVRKSHPDIIHIITNGSRPMEFIDVKGKFLSFGSIVEGTFEAMVNHYTYETIEREEIKPCHLYMIKHGEIINKIDCSSFIEYIPEKLGELKYKIEYKILKRDFYNMAIPLWRCLQKGQPVVNAPVVHTNASSQKATQTQFSTSDTLIKQIEDRRTEAQN